MLRKRGIRNHRHICTSQLGPRWGRQTTVIGDAALFVGKLTALVAAARRRGGRPVPLVPLPDRNPSVGGRPSPVQDAFRVCPRLSRPQHEPLGRRTVGDPSLTTTPHGDWRVPPARQPPAWAESLVPVESAWTVRVPSARHRRRAKLVIQAYWVGPVNSRDDIRATSQVNAILIAPLNPLVIAVARSHLLTSSTACPTARTHRHPCGDYITAARIALCPSSESAERAVRLGHQLGWRSQFDGPAVVHEDD